jgi:hypothetical protein
LLFGDLPKKKFFFGSIEKKKKKNIGVCPSNEKDRRIIME